MFTRTPFTAMAVLSVCAGANADILNVPSEYPTIQSAISAAASGDEVVIADGVYSGSGNFNLNFMGKTITVRSANGPENCVIDGGATARAFTFDHGEQPDAIVQGLTIRNCFAEIGGAVRIANSSRPTFMNCRLLDNATSGPAGAMYVIEGSGVSLIDCVLRDNTAAAAGALFIYESDGIILNSQFINNTAPNSGAAILSGNGTIMCINSLFAQNTGMFLGGGWAHSGPGIIVNSVFSQNHSPYGAGMYIDGTMMVLNSTFSKNTDFGLTVSESGAPVIINSILWDNDAAQIGDDPYQDPGSPSVSYSDVQGGWDGQGSDNIDADPLFVQPGTDNVRLALGSPCIDAGDNASLPDDEYDLDGDGVVDEPIPIDLDGQDRVQGQVVDLGAYEGEYEELPPADVVDDLDPGELATLTPCGGDPDFLENAVVFVINLSGPEDAIFAVTCIAADLYPLAGGFSELSNILRNESSLQDGQFLLRIFMPFNDSILDGRNPLSINALWYEESTGNWRLAVADNTQNSPGYDEPIGDRIAVENSDNNFMLSTELGDYGVFWNPVLQKGFAWANTDHLGDYAIGATLCLSECFPEGGDGVIDLQDVLGLFEAWAEGTEALCDFNGDGVPDISDVLALMANWGQCMGPSGSAPLVALPPHFGPCPPNAACIGDLNRDGSIDLADMIALFGAWGECKGCAEDLNADGTVDNRDLEIIKWRPVSY